MIGGRTDSPALTKPLAEAPGKHRDRSGIGAAEETFPEVAAPRESSVNALK